MIYCLPMEKSPFGRQLSFSVGYVSEHDREVVALSGVKRIPYTVRCNRCGNIVNMASKQLRSPCKRCSYTKSVPLQDLREQIFYKYRYNAELKNIPFEISFEQFCDLISAPCHYCGDEPGRVWRSHRKRENEVIYNGIDRRINADGYVFGNVATCCSTCNYLKRERSVEDLRDIVKKWAGRVDSW